MRPLTTAMFALFVPTLAFGQDAPPQEPSASAVRLRGGISVAGGLQLGSGVTLGSIGTYGIVGLDARLGVQINDLFAVYLQQHGWFGAAGSCCYTGGVATTALFDVTFANRFFIAVGGGMGWHDPGFFFASGGPVMQFRLGGYPFVTKGEDSIRRKGLMVGIEGRTLLLIEGGVVPTGELVATVGYEAF